MTPKAKQRRKIVRHIEDLIIFTMLCNAVYLLAAFVMLVLRALDVA